jgi:hypothetical protein
VFLSSYIDVCGSAYLQVVFGLSLGDGGDGIVDVSGEEPWASIR